MNQIRLNDVYDESRCPGLMGAMARVLTALVANGATGEVGYPGWDLEETAERLTTDEAERLAEEAKGE